jgi:uncharacterized damage-inducible protein DinB
LNDLRAIQIRSGKDDLMVFNNVTELFDSIEQTRAQVYERVERLSEEQAHFRLSDDQWSVAEITEHLGSIESRLLHLVKSLVEQGLASAPVVGANDAIGSISLEHLTAQLTAKGKAPEMFQPTGNKSLAESIEKMRRTREALLALKPDLQSRDFTLVVFTSEQVGALNPYQWVAFLGAHEGKHLNQITALILNESFPALKAAGA